MATNILTKIFGSRNDRLLKQYRSGVARINALEAQYEQLSDDALKAKTQEFKERVAKGETLDAIRTQNLGKRIVEARASAAHLKLPAGPPASPPIGTCGCRISARRSAKATPGAHA